MTPADMQAQVDFIVKRFQESLSRYEIMEKEFKNFQKEKANLQGACQNLAENLASLISEASEKFSFLSDIGKVTQEQINTIQERNTTFATQHEGLKKSLQENEKETRKSILAIVVDYEKNEEAINELNKKYQSFCNSFKVFHDHTSEKLNLQDQKIADASTKHESSSLRIAGFQADIVRIQSNLKEHAQKIANLASDISQSKEYTNLVSNGLEKSLKDHIKEAIAAIPKLQIPSLEDATKATQAKIEPALLDSKNANLRSQNNETKIAILEKKVEQLQLLVNKFQLQV